MASQEWTNLLIHLLSKLLFEIGRTGDHTFFRPLANGYYNHRCMTRTNERAMNIADALKVAIQHQTNSTGRRTLCYDRLDVLLYADSSDLFHFPSVIDTNLLAIVQHSKLQSSCQTAHYPQTPYHIRSLPMVHRYLPLFTEPMTTDNRQSQVIRSQ